MIYLESHQNNLTKEFCNHVIRKFEKDDDKRPGLSGQGINIKLKDSTDLMISSDRWEDEDEFFYKALSHPLNNYLNNCVYPRFDPPHLDTYDTGYQIQKTTPLQIGYDWHHDGFADNKAQRIVTYLWYLNTVDEEGTTEFIDGTKIKPEQGKLILFPSFWTHIHKGNPPKKINKYICTGWVWVKY